MSFNVNQTINDTNKADCRIGRDTRIVLAFTRPSSCLDIPTSHEVDHLPLAKWHLCAPTDLSLPAWMTTSDSSDSTGGDVIFTPAGTESPSHNLRQPSPLRIASLSSNLKAELSPNRELPPLVHDAEDIDEDLELEEMDRPSFRRPSGGHSHTPLLYEGKEDSRGRHDSQDFGGTISRRSTFRSTSPKHKQPENLTRRKYMYAGFFLLVSLVSFVVQTETAVYIQHTLHWDKAYCMLWLTHGSWSLLWPIQLACLRIQKRKISWGNFWRKHVWLVHSTGQMVQSQDLHLSPTTTARNPWPFLIKTTCFITTFLTVAGGSWYVAVKHDLPL